MPIIDLKDREARGLSVSYDPEADAIYVRLRAGKPSRTLGVTDGVQADIDRSGHLLGVEILWATGRHPRLDRELQRLARRYHEPTLGRIRPLKVPAVFAAA